MCFIIKPLYHIFLHAMSQIIQIKGFKCKNYAHKVGIRFMASKVAKKLFFIVIDAVVWQVHIKAIKGWLIMEHKCNY